jgi:hypothetical protein
MEKAINARMTKPPTVAPMIRIVLVLELDEDPDVELSLESVVELFGAEELVDCEFRVGDELVLVCNGGRVDFDEDVVFWVVDGGGVLEGCVSLLELGLGAAEEVG